MSISVFGLRENKNRKSNDNQDIFSRDPLFFTSILTFDYGLLLSSAKSAAAAAVEAELLLNQQV